ncbi:hypothetical protein [Antarcticirhabdus aurantiaca]|uniref:Uncharacterized protein n=1 Tax=Antarcticirhabdus aurantiaca TaxID=2606717 RepID=A0ACD4NRF6_9HYPH|nr:hypothetical protein [Antarcticirhabdus aurantiaca]WAJ29225.1 hypothetical protein OXU80_03020 [Jeongeuplla avenae]
MTDDTRKQPAADADKPGTAAKSPPAGPHARPDLTDPDKTPGTGSLPDADKDEADASTG